MTVDETPVAPPTAEPATTTNIAKKQPHPDQALPTIDGRHVPGLHHPHHQNHQPHHLQQQQQQQQQQSEDLMNFETYLKLHPKTAQKQLQQLIEVTSIKDTKALYRAFDETRSSNNEFNIEHAINWIFNQPAAATASRPLQMIQDFAPVEPTRRTPNRTTSTASHPVQVNIPHPGPSPVAPPNSPKAAVKPLVDLTETSPNIDGDLEKAIQLSLEEARARNTAVFGAGQISQEEQDVSRALEASLMETQLGPGKRKRADNWIDPLNPHDRERNGTWPVGLKNVGQTCWFSAVIQSLFYIPVFRSLVLNFQPSSSASTDLTSTSMIIGAGDEDTNKRSPPAILDERQRKFEFMQELRRLFALLIASQRKYVDPSRAVDILRGFIGGGNGSGTLIGPLNLNDSLGHLGGTDGNDQQDVSEFTHIVLEWVEEAFKKSSSSKMASVGPEMMDDGSAADMEKENNEEKEHRPEDGDTITKSDNPMAQMFYGKVLTEGSIHGKPFSRLEAFGQWPLQVNSFEHIHDSLENSTAHEQLNVSSSAGSCGGTGSTSGPGGSNETAGESGQERWFCKLPPVLFLELSRFQYNTERKVAEKIHNRLDFPEVIFMDRYMLPNKDVTRVKRDQVRVLKEKRKFLKKRLEAFTQYGSGNEDGAESSTTPTRLPLPELLHQTLAFAMSRTSGNGHRVEPDVPFSMSTPLVKPVMSVMMQVDSPCHSPKMTPAHSFSNLAAASSGGDQDVSPMEVEGDEPPASTILNVEKVVAAESKAESPLHVTPPARLVGGEHEGVPEPIPRVISEIELRVLQECLSRWKREVEEDMRSLEADILQIDKAIETMYDGEENLRRFEYRLHAVMVHEGSTDSGHYWAYVRDHKRQVWLKFNDNTVSEVTWDELLRESVGGHSNTSAYSLVYIDAAKHELLAGCELEITVDNNVEPTQDGGEDRMDEGYRGLDLLLKSLPVDLSDFVSHDNDLFRQEMIDWDKKQLEDQRAALEAAAAAKKSSEPMDPNNDVQVVQEKLTYINTHARLMSDFCQKVITNMEMNGSIKEQSNYSSVVKIAMEKTVNHISSHIQKQSPEVEAPPALAVGSKSDPIHDLSKDDPRLDSFVAYLMVNGLTASSPALHLALLEQFAHPGLETNHPTLSLVRQFAEKMLSTEQKHSPEAAAEVRDWHQAYHWFRLSSHCFVSGLDSFYAHQFDKALDSFTEAYHFNMRTVETSPKGPSKALNSNVIVRLIQLALPLVNSALIEKFQRNEELADVAASVQDLIMPSLAILQSRVVNGSCSDSSILETIRSEWCALLGDAQNDAGTILTEILTYILDTDPGSGSGHLASRVSKNRECVNVAADVRLSQTYKDIVTKLKAELLAEGGMPQDC